MILLQGKKKERVGNMMFVRWGSDIWQCFGGPQQPASGTQANVVMS